MKFCLYVLSYVFSYIDMSSIKLIALENIPFIEPNDNLVEIIVESLHSTNTSIESGDIFVIAQKIVSKSENRYKYLDEVAVSNETNQLAKKIGKDPRLLQLIKNESNKIISTEKNVVIVEHKLGYININAGIDFSNIPNQKNVALLLPENPSLSSKNIHRELSIRLKKEISIVISDSMTRPYRSGVVNFALASTNLPSLKDISGKKDLFNNLLKCTEIAIADELASAAGLVMGQSNEKKPVILIKGFNKESYTNFDAADLVVKEENDLYR